MGDTPGLRFLQPEPEPEPEPEPGLGHRHARIAVLQADGRRWLKRPGVEQAAPRASPPRREAVARAPDAPDAPAATRSDRTVELALRTGGIEARGEVAQSAERHT